MQGNFAQHVTSFGERSGLRLNWNFISNHPLHALVGVLTIATRVCLFSDRVVRPRLSLVKRQVYGIEWGNAKPSYTPYERWSDSDKQLLEMVTFDGIKKLKRCAITD